MKKKEIKAVLILLIGAIISLFIMHIFVKYVDMNTPKGVIVIFGFMLYSLFVFIIGNRISRTQNKMLNIIMYTLSAPIAIVILFGRLLGPFMVLSMSLFIYFTFTVFLPVITLQILDHFYIIPVEMNVFVALSACSITAIAFHDRIVERMIKLHPGVKSSYSDKENKVNSDFIRYIFKINNIRYLIYLLYFLFIIIFSIKSINDASFLRTVKEDYAVLQAFLVFLAFDNLRINSKEVKIIASELLTHCIKIIVEPDHKKDEQSK